MLPSDVKIKTEDFDVKALSEAMASRTQELLPAYRRCKPEDEALFNAQSVLFKEDAANQYQEHLLQTIKNLAKRIRTLGGRINDDDYAYLWDREATMLRGAFR